LATSQAWTSFGRHTRNVFIRPTPARPPPTTRLTYFTYDLDNHLTQVNSPEGVINYGYDLATGRLTSTCTANSELSYGYDALGRLQTVTALKRNAVMLSPSETTTYHYDAVGNRSETDLPNGVKTLYTYDGLNRLTNLVHQAGTTNLAAYSYRLDATGRRTNAVEVLWQETGTYLTNTLSWQFDGLYRLTNEITQCSATGYSYTNGFVYDLNGNRLQQTRQGANATTITNAYDGNDELLQEVEGSVLGNWYFIMLSYFSGVEAGQLCRGLPQSLKVCGLHLPRSAPGVAGNGSGFWYRGIFPLHHLTFSDASITRH
jgi:YD repeat-containing protein